MNYTYLIEGIALTLPMAAIIFVVLKWVSGQERLKLEINPKTHKLGPPKLCRGGWNEGELRGCQYGYAKVGIPVEPVNTYTNLFYLVAGWVAYRIIGTETALVFFCAMAFLCFGSALYHGVKTRWSARWDYGGMYAVMAGLTFYVITAKHPYETVIVLTGSILSGVILAWFLEGNLYARMGLLLAFITVGVMTHGNCALGWVSIGVFALAMVAWLVDKNTKVFGHIGHGIWHLFTAVALAIMFGAVK
jgi:hypothetical protein